MQDFVVYLSRHYAGICSNCRCRAGPLSISYTVGNDVEVVESLEGPRSIPMILDPGQEESPPSASVSPGWAGITDVKVGTSNSLAQTLHFIMYFIPPEFTRRSSSDREKASLFPKNIKSAVMTI